MAAASVTEPICAGSVQVCAMRATRLSTGGVPISGADSVVAVVPVEVTTTPQVITGDAFNQKDGCGGSCIDFKDRDRIERTALGLTLCYNDAPLLELLTGGTLVTVGGIPIGFKAPASSVIPDPVCFETWSKAVTGGEQVSDDGLAIYIHRIWPFTEWTAGAETLNNGVNVLPLVGNGRGNAAIGTGPVGDWPETYDTYYGWYYDDALPVLDCGYQTLNYGGGSGVITQP